MATLTATADNATASVLIVGTFAQHPDGTEITVVRITPDGVETPIRGGNPVILSGGGFVLYDLECPLGTAVTYRASAPMTVVLYDTYTRTVAAGGWGTATSGETWNGSASQLSVNGAMGLVTHDAANQSIFADINPGANVANVLLRGTVRVPVVATGASFQTAWRARLNSGDYFAASLTWGLSGALSFSVFKSISSVITTLASETISTTYTGFETFVIQIKIDGTNIFAKAWPTALGEPEEYLITLINGAYDITTGTVGVRSRRETGNTNGTTAIEYDNLYVYDLDTAESTTSGSVTINSGADGWLKDPVRPENNIRIYVDNDLYDPCSERGLDIVFQGLQAEGFVSATGVFPVANYSRPRTVAHLRKDVESALLLVSRRITDVPVLKTLLAPGADLLLQLPIEYGWAYEKYGSDFITVADVTESRIASDMRLPIRQWTIPFAVTDGPADTASGDVGGGEEAIAAATYDAMEATGLTYLALMQQGATNGVIEIFNRTEVNTWGNPNFGAAAWTNNGGAASDYDVTNDVGTHTHTAVDVTHRSSTTHGAADMSVHAMVMLDVVPTGGAIFAQVPVRFTDDNNHYRAQLMFTTSGTAELRLHERVAAVTTNLTNSISLGSTAPGIWWHICVEITGTLLRARAWRHLIDAPPGDWQLSAVSTSIVAGNSLAVRSNLSSTTLNTLPVVIYWDNIVSAQGKTYAQWSQGDWV